VRLSDKSRGTKVDSSKLKKVVITPSEKRDSLQKDKTKKPKKKLKKDRSKRQVKIDNPNSKLWQRKADTAWGRYMHHFKRACLVCRATDGKLDAHHLIGRARVMTRHDPENGVILCTHHHNRDVTCSPHAGPIGFSEFLKEHYPDKFEYVLKNQHKMGRPDYRSAYEKLTEWVK